MDQINLLGPRPGEITPPLQVCRWADFRSEYTNGASPSVNRGFPLGVHLVWESPVSATLDDRRYDVCLSRQANLENGRTWSGLAQIFLDLYDLELGTRYYWQVTERRRGRITAESPLGWFDTHPQPPRWLSAHGIANLRDAGGWNAGPGRRIRQGLLYRSVELNNHFRINPAGRRFLTEELKIRTDLDLRGPEEKPGPALDSERVAYVNAPVDAYDNIILPWSRAGFRLAFETLAQPERYPILVHCWGGADRTGTLIFLLNGLLGVAPDDLTHDYELTSLSGVGRRLATSENFQNMLAVLRGFAPPGAPLSEQFEGYLGDIGITPEQISFLRTHLVESIA
jgi:protein-tyrosine phosphatase